MWFVEGVRPIARSSWGNKLSTPALDTELIISILRRHEIFAEDDVVFVGGSIADGLATPWSDVDVFVVRSAVQRTEETLHLVPMPHDEMTMDLEVWRSSEVESLLRKLRKIRVDSPTDHRAFMRLTEDERDFLHCLAGGISVYNEAGLLKLKAEVDCDLLARLSVARAVVGITNSQTDLLGWLASGDWQSVGTACQRLLDFAALALLGASGSTHPGGKWITALLRKYFDGRQVPPRLLGGTASLVDHYYSLQVKPDGPAAAGSYARRCVNFANQAVIYAQMAHTAAADSALRRILWLPETTESIGDGQARPALTCAAQLRLHSGKWYLLHVGREMYEVNEAAISSLLLVDGRSTERQILDIMEGLSDVGRPQMAQSLRHLLLFLENANLLES